MRNLTDVSAGGMALLAAFLVGGAGGDTDPAPTPPAANVPAQEPPPPNAPEPVKMGLLNERVERVSTDWGFAFVARPTYQEVQTNRYLGPERNAYYRTGANCAPSRAQIMDALKEEATLYERLRRSGASEGQLQFVCGDGYPIVQAVYNGRAKPVDYQKWADLVLAREAARPRGCAGGFCPKP